MRGRCISVGLKTAQPLPLTNRCTACAFHQGFKHLARGLVLVLFAAWLPQGLRVVAPVVDILACLLVNSRTRHYIGVFDGAFGTLEAFAVSPQPIDRHPADEQHPTEENHRAQRGDKHQGLAKLTMPPKTSPPMSIIANPSITSPVI